MQNRISPAEIKINGEEGRVRIFVLTCHLRIRSRVARSVPSPTHSFFPKNANPILDGFFFGFNPPSMLLGGGGARPKGNGAGANEVSRKSRRPCSTRTTSSFALTFTREALAAPTSLRGAGLLLALPRGRGMLVPAVKELRTGEVRLYPGVSGVCGVRGVRGWFGECREREEGEREGENAARSSMNWGFLRRWDRVGRVGIERIVWGAGVGSEVGG